MDLRVFRRGFEVACSACSKRFAPKIREVPDGEGGAFGMFACPNCATEYESYRIDRVGLQLRAASADASLTGHITKGRGRLQGR